MKIVLTFERQLSSTPMHSYIHHFGIMELKGMVSNVQI